MMTIDRPFLLKLSELVYLQAIIFLIGYLCSNHTGVLVSTQIRVKRNEI